MIRKTVYLTLLLVMALALAACGGDDGGDDEGGDAVDLSESFTAEDAGMSTTVSFPEGWVATNDGPTLLVANSQEFLDEINAGVEGEIAEDRIGVIVLPMVPGLDVEATAIDAANFVVENLFGGEDEVNLGDPEEVELGGNSAAILTGEATVEGVTSDGTVVAIQAGDGYAVMIARHNGDFDAEIRAIAGSLEVSSEDEG